MTSITIYVCNFCKFRTEDKESIRELYRAGMIEPVGHICRDCAQQYNMSFVEIKPGGLMPLPKGVGIAPANK